MYKAIKISSDNSEEVLGEGSRTDCIILAQDSMEQTLLEPYAEAWYNEGKPYNYIGKVSTYDNNYYFEVRLSCMC